LLPDGSERRWRRIAPPSIREQLALLRMARRLGAQAVVAECMALDPELQWISERHMVRATIGVITNVRRDHEEVMGERPEEIASSLANTIPAGGVLVCGDERCAALTAARASQLGTRVAVAPSPLVAGASHLPRWLEEDRATALAVTRELGVDDEVATRGFDEAPADPGAVSGGTIETREVVVPWIDATAANDPESLAQLIAGAWGDGGIRSLALVYNHRQDRGPRLSTFVRHSGALRNADTVIVTGARPALGTWLALRRARASRSTAYVPLRRLATHLRALPPASHLVFCGNTRSFDAHSILRAVSADG
jgi:poly-gamma-glutamate synthase PgsB/CapB